LTDSIGSDRPNDHAQKWGSIALGAAAIFVAGWMTYESMDPRPQAAKHEDAGAAVASTATAVTSAAPTSTALILIDASVPMIDLDGGLALPSLSLDAALLPSSAPRSVKMGVILITFAGAEGAPNNARPKDQAKEVAAKLLPMAQADFHQAVNQGDSGSADDIGRIPRGVLEPPVENAVFGLGTNDVSDVIETAKGYWIVKRLD
jgi:hypothetical protein